MNAKKVLYVSGSLGLGHVVRDLAIVKELRRRTAGIEVSWLASHPASFLLREAGEDLLPESHLCGNENITAEEASEKGHRLNLLKYLLHAGREWGRNVTAFRAAVRSRHFDLVIADEAYELAVAVAIKAVRVHVPFVMLYDFFGMDSATRNALEKLLNYSSNVTWLLMHKLLSRKKRLGLFVGEPEDIPDGRLGFLLPNRREFAKATLKFVGYVLPFDPGDYSDKGAIRARLGYGEEPLVVCTIGGTSIGTELLELCGRAYPIIRERIPNVHMVLVCGPRLDPASLTVPMGMDVRGYVPALYEHLAASDLAIVQGGGTTTLELTALRRPFLYFPLEEHFEQRIHVAGRLRRHRAGIGMSYRKTTPEILAEKVISNIGRAASYPTISTDGAQKTAQVIGRFL